VNDPSARELATGRAAIVLYALMFVAGAAALAWWFGGTGVGAALSIYLVACFGAIVSTPMRYRSK